MYRNKRAVVIDLKSPQGRELALRLLDAADVLVENFRPGVLDWLGLGEEVLKQRNPRLVTVRNQRLRPDRSLPRAAGAMARSARPWPACAT